MDSYQMVVQTVALTAGAAWASGINLYAVLVVLGVGGATGAVGLPAELAVVEHPLVIAAALLMYCVEFFADKIPGVDSTWDAIHTFVRVPAGAMLAAGAMGDVTPAWEVAAGLLGGSLAMTSHASKASARALINTSPEPFSNWTASVAEDIAVLAGLWAALAQPEIFLLALVLFLVLVAWLLPRLLRGVAGVLRILGIRRRSADANEASRASDRLGALERLQALRASGALGPEEFAAEKARVLTAT